MPPAISGANVVSLFIRKRKVKLLCQDFFVERSDPRSGKSRNCVPNIPTWILENVMRKGLGSSENLIIFSPVFPASFINRWDWYSAPYIRSFRVIFLNES
jgi:hypothetical protein